MVALRIARAAVKLAAFFCEPRHQLPGGALRTGNAGSLRLAFLVEGLRVFAVGESGAGEEFSEAAAFYGHGLAASYAYLVGLLLDELFLNLLVLFRKMARERLVERPDNRLPRSLSFSDFVEFLFHVRGEGDIHDFRKVFDQKIVDDTSGFRGLEVSPVNALDVSAVLNG